MVFIRQTSDEDNQALLDLERMCPQGTSLVLQFDRSPDFFRRSQVYENRRIYVAEEEGKIIGTVSSTVKEFNLDRKNAKGIYIYDLRVHPNYRGKGIGSSLLRQAIAEEHQAHLAYGIIMEENHPSIALFKKMEFQNIHDITLLNVPLYKRQEKIKSRVRTMTAEDVPRVIDLINGYYHNRDFFFPLSITDFLDKTSLSGYEIEKIQVVEVGNRIVGCAGLWDYSDIFRISALRVSARMRMMAYLLRFINIFKKTARLPLVGEPFRLMYVRDLAFSGETDLVTGLIEHCLSLSHSYGCHFLSFVLDPNDPAIPLLEGYKPIKVTYHVYAKSLEEKALSSPTMIYVDPVDL